MATKGRKKKSEAYRKAVVRATTASNKLREEQAKELSTYTKARALFLAIVERLKEFATDDIKIGTPQMSSFTVELLQRVETEESRRQRANYGGPATLRWQTIVKVTVTPEAVAHIDFMSYHSSYRASPHAATIEEFDELVVSWMPLYLIGLNDSEEMLKRAITI